MSLRVGYGALVGTGRGKADAAVSVASVVQARRLQEDVKARRGGTSRYRRGVAVRRWQAVEWAMRKSRDRAAVKRF